ncbi:MAG TPA: STAS domain-containing protein [Solirubrobacterales bacterium]|nr:STAS domain-containing protein [Solirubrobacterales bacterium]
MSPTPFQVDATEIDGVRVLAVHGELDLGTAAGLEQPLEAALDVGSDPLLLDLSACEFIDSTGIALIVRTWQRLDGEGAGSRLAIAIGNDQVQRVLAVSGLGDSIPILPGRDAALAALRRSVAD